MKFSSESALISIPEAAFKLVLHPEFVSFLVKIVERHTDRAEANIYLGRKWLKIAALRQVKMPCRGVAKIVNIAA